MSVRHRELLKDIRTFPSLIKYLRDELDWPIHTQDFEELTFDYTAEELGIDGKSAAKIQEIKRLRPLSPNQPWGIFFVKFEPKRLPVVALRRILSRVVVKKRASANSAERAAWEAEDLLFVSNYGEGEERKISLAHFTQDRTKNDLPTLKVLGWDNLDTALHLDHVAEELHEKLAWPEDENNIEVWRKTWRSAFTLRHREVITTSKVLAIKLAELARDIRARIKTVLTIETDDGPVRILMKAFQEALIHDLDEDGFADMYAQTIAYGLLSAQIYNPKGDAAAYFVGQFQITNPFLNELMETFISVGDQNEKARTYVDIDFDEFGISEITDLLQDANIEAVVRDFGDRNPMEDPVIHFYELFLKEYDAKKRMQRGVFYTPRPVVSYIVRSVDEILRMEFNLEDGLADTTTWGSMTEQHEDIQIPENVKAEDPFVQILDPATGTGTFLVEVINLIYKRMSEKWRRQGKNEHEIQSLWNEYVPKSLLPRIHGYEILMAPYAIAHLKIALKLFETGYRFGSQERIRIYLTNSLEPAQDYSDRLSFAIPALAHEAEAVNRIKRRQQYTVIIGNPPYAYLSGNRGDWITQLIRPYYYLDDSPLRERNPRGLSDDYVKFIRYAQYQIEDSGCGILAYISNHGYINNPTFRGMRKSLLDTFSEFYVLDLHGNLKREEKSPDGSTDVNVFDIQQGVAIGIFVKERSSSCYQCAVKHADIWGSRAAKYNKLLSNDINTIQWGSVEPKPPFYLFEWKDADLLSEYTRGWKITELMLINNVGMVTARDNLTMHFAEENIWNTVVEFAQLSPEEARIRYNLGNDSRDWVVRLAQADIISSGPKKEHIVKTLYRPFDIRYTYYTAKVKGFISYPRNDLMRHMLLGENIGLITDRQVNAGFRHTFCSKFIIDKCSVSLQTREASYLFPLYIYEDKEHKHDLIPLGSKEGRMPNLSQNFIIAFENEIGLRFDPDGIGGESLFMPEDIFQYIYTVLHSQIYRNRYSEFLKTDFPRLPLTSNVELFRELAQLGAELISLHLMESSKLDEHITTLVGCEMFKVEKISYIDKTVWIDKAKTCGFRGIPENVWNFHIGGYQVCEKWLKDRQTKGGKNPRPGRVLANEDLVYYQKIVVAINETIRIMKEIDEVIDEHGGWPDAFTSGEK